MPTEILVGDEWIETDETPAKLRDIVSDADHVDMAAGPMATWVAVALPQKRMMRVALGRVNGIRWDDDEDR
jgi:hypothetical protein